MSRWLPRPRAVIAAVAAIVVATSGAPTAGRPAGAAVGDGSPSDPNVRYFGIVEFVGDSITVGQQSSKQALTAYGWLVGERLGVEHT